MKLLNIIRVNYVPSSPRKSTSFDDTGYRNKIKDNKLEEVTRRKYGGSSQPKYLNQETREIFSNLNEIWWINVEIIETLFFTGERIPD